MASNPHVKNLTLKFSALDFRIIFKESLPFIAVMQEATPVTFSAFPVHKRRAYQISPIGARE